MINVLLVLLNYSHDIATALLIVSGILMVLLYVKREDLTTGSSVSELADFYRINRLITEGSLLWILLAGVPRTVFYKRYEWSYLAGDLQVGAIVVKHIVMFTLVGGLIYYWIRLSRFIKAKQLNK